MKKFRTVLLVIAMVIIGINLFLLDYINLWQRENLGGLLVILSMILLIVSLILSIREERKQR